MNLTYTCRNCANAPKINLYLTENKQYFNYEEQCVNAVQGNYVYFDNCTKPVNTL